MRAVNLIPSEQRSGSAVGAGRSGGGAYAVLALVLGAALLALLYGSARHEVSSRSSQAATLTTEAAQAQNAASRLAPFTSFIALREARMQAVSQLVNSRFDWAHAFHEFGRVLPPEVSISSLSGVVGSSSTTTSASSSTPGAAAGASAAGAGASGAGAGASSGSATPPGAVPTFTLAGCATNQPAVALMLERLRLIDGVKEVQLGSSTKGNSGSGASSGASSGGCPGGSAIFTVQVVFDPLPSIAAASAVSRTVADSTTSTPTSTKIQGATAR